MIHIEIVSNVLKPSTAIVLCLLLLITGCNQSEIHRQISGSWSVERIMNNDRDLLPLFLDNLIIFREGGTCHVPINDEDKVNAGEGKWAIREQSGMHILEIRSSEEVFSNDFRIEFRDTIYPEFIPVMALMYEDSVTSSRNLEIICHKFGVEVRY